MQFVQVFAPASLINIPYYKASQQSAWVRHPATVGGKQERCPKSLGHLSVRMHSLRLKEEERFRVTAHW